MPRRARPTLRVLSEDLRDGWDNPFVRRAIESGDLASIQPMNTLEHPILRKASSSFTEDPAEDSYIGPISAVSSETLLEIKSGQWRAGVWIDDDACWVVVAGLAKGGHEDHDDFYKRLERVEAAGSIAMMLPAQADRDLLKGERASALITSWQLKVQSQLLTALDIIAGGGSTQIDIASPAPRAEDGDLFARIALEAVPGEDDYPYEDVTLTIDVDDRWKNTQLSWHLTMQALATISPPEKDWDLAGGIFSTLLEPGSLSRRRRDVEGLQREGKIAKTQAGTEAHYTHRRNLAEMSVEGKPVRAMCGVYFVPRRAPDPADVCPVCTSLHTDIPAI